MFAMLSMMFVLMQSCGRSQEQTGTEQVTLRLCVIDSIDSNVDDSLQIWSITTVCSNPSGGYFILDAASLCVHLVGEDNEATTLIRGGEGPGKLQAPQSMCVTPWGDLLVGDAMKREVMSFSLDGCYEGPFMHSARYVPAPISVRSDSTLVGAMQGIQMDEETVITYRIAVFGDSLVEEYELLSREWVWPDPAVYAEAPLTSFSAGSQGAIFVCGNNTIYHVDVFSESGMLLGQIDRSDVPRMEKTPEEIEEERAAFDIWLRQDAAYTGGYEPYPYRQVLQLAGVDSQQRLWVRRLDVGDRICCDLWSQTGEYLGCAELPWDDASTPVDCVVDAGGIYLTSAQSAENVVVYRLQECN